MSSDSINNKVRSWPWTTCVDATIYDAQIQWPKISVVTPSFNQGGFIEETILSVLNQNYPDIEYIIIDGGSTDNTVSIIKKYEADIFYWVSEPDKGQTNALNKGIVKANGDILFWINSDDYFEPEAFYKVALQFVKNPSLQVVCAVTNIFGNGIQCYNQTLVTNDIVERSITMHKFEQPATIFSMRCIKEIGMFDDAYHFIMDREFWVNFQIRYGMNQVAVIPDVIVNFRLHAVSKTVSQNSRFDLERDEMYIGLIKDIMPDLYSRLVKLLGIKERSVDRILKNLANNNQADIHVLLNYYLYFRSMEFYEAGNKHILSQLLSMIDVKALLPADRMALRKLRLKKLLPYKLKKIIQKIRLGR